MNSVPVRANHVQIENVITLVKKPYLTGCGSQLLALDVLIRMLLKTLKKQELIMRGFGSFGTAGDRIEASFERSF